MEESQSFPMAGGEGAYSYTKNSIPQKEAADKANPMLVAAILENIDIKHLSSGSKLLRIADLGCSTGPNTFIAVKNIIEAMEQKYHAKGHNSDDCLEFQVFFSDHVSNDFNTLFIGLPPVRKYFATGVPGSFHGRLFPEASLDFVYSSCALHWLSKAPKELGDLNSPTCNKGKIDYVNAPDEVGQAYASQYAKDMESFLAARAQELAPGGLMALIIPGRPAGTLPAQYSLGPTFPFLESCLVNMVSEGIVPESKLDSFNLPFYSPATDELQKLIEENGCYCIAKLERAPQAPVTPVHKVEECRAGMQGIIEHHFGSEIMEQIFERYAKDIAGQLPCPTSEGIASSLFVLLKRKH